MVGLAFLAVAVVTTVVGLLSAVLLDGPGRRIAVSGFYHALGGLVFRPSTWERLSYSFYPQRTPMIGILLVVSATGALWIVLADVLAG